MAIIFTPIALGQGINTQGTITVKKHPSKWVYPTEITLRPGQQLHIVEKGNTFWALGRIYLGNPYLWPQIWEHNKWIADPHWIYPGDPIIVPAGGEVIDHAASPDPEIVELQPDHRDSPYPRNHPLGPAGYAFSYQDYLQLPYLAPKGAEAHFKELKAVRVTGSQKEERRYFSKGDVVYLDGGLAKNHQPGDRMMVMKVVKPKLLHPDIYNGQHPLGDVVQHAAILRILSIHPKNSEAVIEDAIDGVEIGDRAAPIVEPFLIPHSSIALRDDTLEPVRINTNAKILYAKNGSTYVGPGSLVIIDKGTKAGLNRGDILICVRQKALVNIGPDDPKPAPKSPMTNRYLGQLLVVKAGENYSTCIIVYTRSEMTLGDIVTN
jgi:hypothetical protein